MSKKSPVIAARIRAFTGGELDPHFAGYFDCFNHQQFYEAHDVLEELWLPLRRTDAGDFYKGLIQIAGAFVHLQKQRIKPALALLDLAAANLRRYPAIHAQLHVAATLQKIALWRAQIEAGDVAALLTTDPPRLEPHPSLVGIDPTSVV
jgi:predicted metal-dependent hydrolase